ncbi:MAG TPA: DUF4383 domain-containing protein [Solirubrobacterales bacterium]|nr:DUF4383 domain-containing protein [Solirubrobacterales bacterium]
MEAASPARLYAAAAGAFLLLLGIAGFFYSASFGAPGDVEKALGAFDVNAWANLLYVAAGAIGLLSAGLASRRYALAAGALFTVLAIWGFSLERGGDILGFLPAGGADDFLRLAVGLLGLAAAAATPRRSRVSSRRGRRDSEPRAQAAG